MQLESLPNELILNLFEFINSVHLIHAFVNLNFRFDNLLIIHFQSNLFDFQFISKTDFDIICQQYLPSWSHRITSLHLSDDEETPQLTACFLSHKLRLNQFVHLQALSLSQIVDQSIMNKMINGLQHLHNLLSLKIIHCTFKPTHIDNIWGLPKLTHFKLSIIEDINCATVPTVPSLSLQILSIHSKKGLRLCPANLFKHSFHLQHFSLGRFRNDYNKQILSIIPSMKILNLKFENSIDELINILESMPNLTQITIQISSMYVDGYQWEKMITDYLPKLKLLRLLMKFSSNDINSELEVSGILDTFRTPFWIEKHHWFVRCHWNVEYSSQLYCLYTLPYTFKKFNFEKTARFQSTCSHDKVYNSYNSVRALYVNHDSVNGIPQIHFSNLQHLQIQAPIQDCFWSVISILNRLTSLFVYMTGNVSAQSQLQTLLDRAPCLYLFEIHSDSDIHIPPIELTSKSIRRLGFVSVSRSVIDEEACIELCKSSMGIQCEVLSIDVNNRNDILYLVNNMKNLRVLKLRCRDDQSGRRIFSQPSMSIKDEFVEWLQEHLSPTCIIQRDKFIPVFIRLWIG